MRWRDLGPMTVEVDGREVVVNGAKLVAILAMLVLHANQRVTVDALIDAVWGPLAGPDRVVTLESHIWRLRRLLEPNRRRGEQPRVLVKDPPGYRLLALTDEIDSVRFDRLAQDVDELLATGRFDRVVSTADAALALWRGPAYAALADTQAVQAVLARLGEQRRQVGARRLDALLELGQPARVLGDVEVLLAEDRFDEHLWSVRMLALHRVGRITEALSTFKDARRILRNEAGIDPGPELTTLQEHILAGSVNPPIRSADAPVRVAAGPPVLLPLSPEPILGRDRALRQLQRLIREQSLVTIVGVAGCGKTRLAIELARQASRTFPDGTYFVDLAAVEEPSLVVDVALSTIGVAPATTGTALDGLRAFCRDRGLLLVLDNCEHVVAEASKLAETVIRSAPDSVVVATSREPLDVHGEVLWALAPLGLPDDDGDDDDGESPAVALFLDRMRAAGAAGDVSPAQRSTIVSICRALDGVPLAIELAAARVRSATLEEIAADVQDDPSGLRRPARGRNRDEVSVRSSIETGHRLLSGPEQTLHRRLAVLPGAFTRHIAAAVCTGEDVERGDVSYLLDALVRRSLLTCAPSLRVHGPTVFRQLATVRGHARHALRISGEEAAARQRRNDWFAAFVASRPRLAADDDNGWYPTALEALPTIRAALEDMLILDPVPLGTRLITRLTMFWYFTSHLAEGARWAVVVAARPPSDPLTQATSDISIAAGDAVRGRPDLAVSRAQRALARLRGLRLDNYSPADLIELGDHYAPLAVALAPAAATATIAALASSAGELAAAASDGGLAVLAQALDCAAQLRGTDPRASATRAATIYQQAEAAGHLFAALIAGGINIALALAARDPRGRVWAERNYELHRRQGGNQRGLLLEHSANFAAFGDDRHEAIRLFAASRADARRAGTDWPRNALTRRTLVELRSTSSTTEFERAWRDGLAGDPESSAPGAADQLHSP